MLLRELIPYRAAIANSLERFFQDNFVVDPEAHYNTVFSNFLDEYSSYCAAERLPEIRDENKIRLWLTVTMHERGCRKYGSCIKKKNSGLVKIRLIKAPLMLTGLRIRYPDREMATTMKFFGQMNQTARDLLFCPAIITVLSLFHLTAENVSRLPDLPLRGAGAAVIAGSTH